MDYKQRLVAFNSTEKYLSEMQFIKSILDIKPSERILDFGCGIGTLINYLQKTTEAKILGHDVVQYIDPCPDWFRHSIFFKVDKIYFMHSLAHISNPEITLEILRAEYLNENGRICVITPNKIWLDKVNKAEYKSDETVIKHFDLEELKKLFCNFKLLNYGQFGQNIEGVQERLFLIAEKY